ncbi:ABC transporter permease [Micromonospora chokoriensis]|uniref:ABC transporter permease n=1 Tax=Micromonospora chokoriensis TaxID=356851 RepID=UPI000AD73500|nr:ABC transporter permease [Micromonospora chokoriensis]
MLRAFGYWVTRYRRTWRGSIVINVLNPLLFLIGIGAGLGALVDDNAPAQIAGVSYAAFFAPGMLAAAAMQNAFLEGSAGVARAASFGAYRSATPTPLAPEQLAAGHLLFITFRLLIASGAFIAVMAAFGLVGGWWALGALLGATLTGVAFAAPAAAWAVGVRKLRHIDTVFRFVIMPFYMFSGTFFAVSQLPEWIRPVSYLLPLWHGVELCRTLSLGTATVAGSSVHIAYLLALAIGGFLVARVTYRRRLHP